MMINKYPNIVALTAIALMVIVYYLPMFINSPLLLQRGNDLEEVFWPVFYFIRETFLKTGTIPLWNNLFLSGTPILPDPQFSLFYPFNWLFLFFPTDMAFMLYFLIHTFLAGLGTFWLTKNGFKFSYYASLFTSLLYIFTPKSVGFLEAGHYGLLATLTWMPFIILAVLKLSQNPNIRWTVLLAVSLAGLFYTHTIIFLIFIIIAPVVYFTLMILENKLSIKKSSLVLIFSFILTFGLISATLLPQLEWMPDTTRFLLLKDRDVYPKWTGKKEFLELSILPWIFNIDSLQQLDSEKWIISGTMASILACIGFWKINRKLKIATLLVLLAIIFIALNNASPIYSFLIDQDWFVLMRVATRPWIVLALITTLLAGYGFDYFVKLGKNNKLIILIICLTIIESVALVYIRMFTPVQKKDIFVANEVYEFLSKDKDHFRIYCTTRCIPQKQAALNHLELIDGYNTLQQKNFYQQSLQLMGGHWNYYTLSLPPIGSYSFEKLQPDPIALGNYNAKYVISAYPLSSIYFQLEKQFGKHLIYKNLSFRQRAYYADTAPKPNVDAQIVYYSPNNIQVNTVDHPSNSLILSEVYNPAWKAYKNGSQEIAILERPDRLRSVSLQPDASFIEFRYKPKSFLVGKLLLTITISSIIAILFKSTSINLFIFRKH